MEMARPEINFGQSESLLVTCTRSVSDIVMCLIGQHHTSGLGLMILLVSVLDYSYLQRSHDCSNIY